MSRYQTLRAAWRKLTLSTALVAGVIALLGCGGNADGPPRFDVSGAVSYDGLPLKHGRIAFMPDDSQGNAGPTGYAEIQDGTYDTAAEGSKGVAAGAVTVVIEGYGEPSAAGTDAEIEQPLFERFETTANIAGDASLTNLDFSIPAAGPQR